MTVIMAVIRYLEPTKLQAESILVSIVVKQLQAVRMKTMTMYVISVVRSLNIITRRNGSLMRQSIGRNALVA